MDRAVLEIELASGDDILGFLGGVGVPTEPLARLDLVDDCRGGVVPPSPP
jgi:hypothetical protein